MATEDRTLESVQLSPTEILVVAVVALLVLGPERLPSAARQVGRAIGELKRFSSDMQTRVNEVIDDEGRDENASSKTETARSQDDVSSDGGADGSRSDRAADGARGGDTGAYDGPATDGPGPDERSVDPGTDGFELIDRRPTERNLQRDANDADRGDEPGQGS